MTETIEVRKVAHQGKKYQYHIDEVQCPMTNDSQAARRCKTCQHCRIYLGEKVKCTYADDQRRKELQIQTII